MICATVTPAIRTLAGDGDEAAVGRQELKEVDGSGNWLGEMVGRKILPEGSVYLFGWPNQVADTRGAVGREVVEVEVEREWQSSFAALMNENFPALICQPMMSQTGLRLACCAASAAGQPLPWRAHQI